MSTLITVLVGLAGLALLTLALAVRIVKQYGAVCCSGSVDRWGHVRQGCGSSSPAVDVLHRVSLRIITTPIQSQGIITRACVCGRWLLASEGTGRFGKH